MFFAFSGDVGEPQEETAQVVGGAPAAEDVFREEAKGQDAAHWGKGTVKIYRQPDGSLVLEFRDDFKSGPIPAPGRSGKLLKLPLKCGLWRAETDLSSGRIPGSC